MGKRKKRNKPSGHKQDNTLDTLSVSASDLQIHDAPYHKDSPDKSRKEPNPMRNPFQVIKAWWSHLGDAQNSNRIVAIFTIVIALTSIVYARFAYNQWRAMRDQIAEMQQANRPYIFALPRYASNGPKQVPNFNEFPVTMMLADLGTSPAIKVQPTVPEVLITGDAGAMEKVDKCSFSYESLHQMKIAAGAANSVALATVRSRFISDSERGFIMDRKEQIVILGGVRYSGVTGGDFETTYCFVWMPESLSNPSALPFGECGCDRLK